MAQFSNCLSIISRMSERDQGSLVARLDELQAQGVPAEKAQVQAAIDVLMRAQADEAGIQRSAARDVTETPEFLRWFADSKVVDAEGKPLVVYHGAASGFTEFKKKNIGARDPGFFGSGFYFAPDEDSAQGYADSASEADGGTKSGEVIDAYVSLKNPFIWDMEPGDGAKATRAALAKFGVDRSSVRGDSAALGSPDERKRFNSAVRSAGHDGVIVRDEDGIREVVAFEPEQIKSATGNSGAFDPNDADITRSVSRDTYAWRDSIDTSVGPLLQGEDFYLLPQREITQDDFGDNGFAANGLMGHAERAVPGTRTIAYRIVGDNGIIGTLVSDVDPAGVLRSVHDIEITDRRGGVGSKIVATIAANTQSPIKIQDITDEADPFWTRIGVGYKDQYGDAFLDWEDVAQYLGARRAAQLDPDATASGGRGRGLQEGSYEVTELSDEEAAGLFKFSLPRPAFYSQLQRAIEQVPDRLATMAAPQWKLWLDANASKLGIKKDEIEWSGVKDYLTLRGKDKVTRDELVAYLADSGVRVQEVVLGNQSDRQKLSNEYGRAVAASDAAGGAMNPIYIESLAPGDRKPEEQALLDAWNRVNENPDESWLPGAGNPKYGQYTVPGGENYREVLITLPVKRELPAGYKVEPNPSKASNAKKFIVVDGDGERYGSGDTQQEALDRYFANHTPNAYRSSHWEQPNILAHMRVDDRTDADGKRVLFINEVQSDFGQDFKKARDAISKAVDDDFQGIVDRMKKAGVLRVECD